MFALTLNFDDNTLMSNWTTTSTYLQVEPESSTGNVHKTSEQLMQELEQLSEQQRAAFIDDKVIQEVDLLNLDQARGLLKQILPIMNMQTQKLLAQDKRLVQMADQLEKHNEILRLLCKGEA